MCNTRSSLNSEITVCGCRTTFLVLLENVPFVVRVLANTVALLAQVLSISIKIHESALVIVFDGIQNPVVETLGVDFKRVIEIQCSLITKFTKRFTVLLGG